ncbi:MAG: hypothetical protein R3337_02200 [Gammaproteobacteria bacterium]|nr:hypothetical protein [Gammaproteobacteria bacterium]
MTQINAPRVIARRGCESDGEEISSQEVGKKENRIRCQEEIAKAQAQEETGQP